MDAPFDDYDEYTVKEAKAAVREGDIDPADVLAYERDNKDRVTLTRWLERRLDDSDDADDGSETEQVRVASTRAGMIAGIFFDGPHETRVVERGVRVEEAIRKGNLRELEYDP